MLYKLFFKPLNNVKMEDDLRKNLYMTRLIAYGLFISLQVLCLSHLKSLVHVLLHCISKLNKCNYLYLILLYVET